MSMGIMLPPHYISSIISYSDVLAWQLCILRILQAIIDADVVRFRGWLCLCLLPLAAQMSIRLVQRDSSGSGYGLMGSFLHHCLFTGFCVSRSIADLIPLRAALDTLISQDFASSISSLSIYTEIRVLFIKLQYIL